MPVHAPGARRAVGAVVVGYSMEPLEHVQHDVLLGSLVLAALVLLAGGALAIRSALDGALRPVAQMTAHAEDWGAHDLDRRFELGPPRDELTGLAATLDGLLSRIAASRRHEQRFASEVAHELRTPIAGAARPRRAGAARDGRTPTPSASEALRAVVDDAARLDRAIDTLLAVARRELDPSEGSVDLAALAREVDDVGGRGPRRAADAPRARPDVVRRALAPLVDNARRHARTRHRARGRRRRRPRARSPCATTAPGSIRRSASGPSTPACAATGETATARGSGCRWRGAWRAPAAATSSLGPGPGGCFVLELPAVGPATVR